MKLGFNKLLPSFRKSASHKEISADPIMAQIGNFRFTAGKLQETLDKMSDHAPTFSREDMETFIKDCEHTQASIPGLPMHRFFTSDAQQEKDVSALKIRAFAELTSQDVSYARASLLNGSDNMPEIDSPQNILTS